MEKEINFMRITKKKNNNVVDDELPIEQKRWNYYKQTIVLCICEYLFISLLPTNSIPNNNNTIFAEM